PSTIRKNEFAAHRCNITATGSQGLPVAFEPDGSRPVRLDRLARCPGALQRHNRPTIAALHNRRGD
ncbi:MAG TPA: hypothetical protein PKE36_03900, partial [Chiayiivirga sp.]|nr:hypothetical protein [Chiayiivirga sp.]